MEHSHAGSYDSILRVAELPLRFWRILPIAAVELRPMRMEFNLTDEHGNIVELDPALVRAHRAVLFIDVVE